MTIDFSMLIHWTVLIAGIAGISDSIDARISLNRSRAKQDHQTRKILGKTTSSRAPGLTLVQSAPSRCTDGERKTDEEDVQSG